MPFDPTSFANLIAFDTGTFFDHPTFPVGEGAWAAENVHECATWSDPGHILGSVTCPGWDRPPDPDPVTFDWSTSGADFITIRVTGVSAIFDVGTGGGEFLACKIEADGGGCNYRDPLDGLMQWRTQGGDLISGVEDDGTPTGSGPWQAYPLSGVAAERMVNPNPVTYYGIDPTNSANEILWRPDDLASVLWHWVDGLAANKAGGAHDLTADFGVTLWRYITPPPPVGFMCVL